MKFEIPNCTICYIALKQKWKIENMSLIEASQEHFLDQSKWWNIYGSLKKWISKQSGQQRIEQRKQKRMLVIGGLGKYSCRQYHSQLNYNWGLENWQPKMHQSKIYQAPKNVHNFSSKNNRIDLSLENWIIRTWKFRLCNVKNQ